MSNPKTEIYNFGNRYSAAISIARYRTFATVGIWPKPAILQISVNGRLRCRTSLQRRKATGSNGHGEVGLNVSFLAFPKLARIDYLHKRSTVVLPSTFRRSSWTLQPILPTKCHGIKEDRRPKGTLKAQGHLGNPITTATWPSHSGTRAL